VISRRSGQLYTFLNEHSELGRRELRPFILLLALSLLTSLFWMQMLGRGAQTSPIQKCEGRLRCVCQSVIHALTTRWTIRSRVGCSGVDVEGDPPNVGADGNIDAPMMFRRTTRRRWSGRSGGHVGGGMRLWWRPPRLHLSASMRMFG
jgi:hypothetical protein